MAFDDCHVESLDPAFSPEPGQRRQRIGVASKENRAARHPVEAVQESKKGSPAHIKSDRQQHLLIEGQFVWSHSFGRG